MSASCCSFAYVDIYMAQAGGSDENTGLTPANPVATLSAAYAVAIKMAGCQLPPALVVIHVASGTYAWAPMPFALTIIGDGAGQAGDTGLTTVATGVSDAGTDATNLTLPAPVAVNAYRGLTLEWQSGPASGQRKSIRDNTATVVTPVEVAGYPTVSIDPGVGSDFAILRPAVIFLTATAEVAGVVQLVDAINSSREYLPVALVNVRLTMSAVTVRGVVSSARVRLFGVEVNPGILSLIDSQVDGGFVLPEAAMNAWALRVGLTGFAQITNWIGWGVTWPAAGIADQSFHLGAGSIYRGVFVVGTLVPNTNDLTQSGTLELHGGSALGDIVLFRTVWLQQNPNIRVTCRSLQVSNSYCLTRRMTCDGGGVVTPYRLETGAVHHMYGHFTSQNSNTYGAFLLRDARLFIRGAAAVSIVGATVGMVVDQARVVINNAASCLLQGNTSGLQVSGAGVFLSETANPLTINGTVTAGAPAIDISEDSTFLCELGTVLIANGPGGGARVRQNSRLTLLNPNFTLAAAIAGSGVVCSGGGACYFPGGAGNVITGAGAGNFGVNCRGGGRAFFLNAPPATVTGPGGDLTVGVAVGETVASAALAAPLSGVRDLFASVIARVA